MKLISLNLWGGQMFPDLMQFLKDQSAETDIFCFQEVFDTPTTRTESRGIRPNLLTELKKTLADYNFFFDPAEAGYDNVGPVDFPLTAGLGMFIKKSLTVLDHGDTYVYRERNSLTTGALDAGNFPRNLQFVRFTWKVQGTAPSRWATVFNLHGLWDKSGKHDTPDRLRQSVLTKEFMAKFPGPKILAGDFNLNPETESLKILEKEMRNLIKEYKVPTTRGSLYHFYSPTGSLFADYVLVSPEIKVNTFQTLNIAVSDHLPLELDFTI